MVGCDMRRQTWWPDIMAAEGRGAWQHTALGLPAEHRPQTLQEAQQKAPQKAPTCGPVDPGWDAVHPPATRVAHPNFQLAAVRDGALGQAAWEESRQQTACEPGRQRGCSLPGAAFAFMIALDRQLMQSLFVRLAPPTNSHPHP